MVCPVPPEETRSIDRLRYHYETERALADRLRGADASERRRLYAVLYDELYRQVPDHPMLTRKVDENARAEAVARQAKILRRFLRPGCTFLEVGAGDCSLCFALASHTKKVYAIEVSAEIAKQRPAPENFELALSDGCSIPVPPESVDVAYSNQVMEHLHPQDAEEQLEGILRALKPGGRYVCITPNRVDGPHDVSKYFEEVAKGFHMKEYRAAELADLFRRAGFRRVHALVPVKGRAFLAPVWPVTLTENLLRLLPGRARRSLAGRFPFRSLVGLNLVATK